MFADQALDGLPAVDPGGYIDGVAGLVPRRPLFPSLVGSVVVVVLRVSPRMCTARVWISITNKDVQALEEHGVRPVGPIDRGGCAAHRAHSQVAASYSWSSR